MKKTFVQISLSILLVAGIALPGCKPKDADIQTSFNEKARENAQMANISGTVTDGVITLTGQCPDEACRTNAEATAKDVKGVKSVVNNITVMAPAAPVVVNDDGTIRSSVNSILSAYPGVTAEVQNGSVTLRGTIKRDNLQKLMMAINEANIRNVNNQLTVK
jgi:osmotically-inducible protein OsmY